MRMPEDRPLRNWIVMGIDPGVIPTVCVLWDRGHEVRFFEGSAVHSQDPRGFGAADPSKLTIIADHYRPDLIVLENVWVMPNQGVVTQAGLVRSMGVAFGWMRTWAEAHNRSTICVKPQAWQKALYIPYGATKKGHRLWADQTIPGAGLHVQQQKDHDRADAALLAWFGLHYLDLAHRNAYLKHGAAWDHTPEFHVFR